MGMIRNLNFNPVKTTAEKAKVIQYCASHSREADGVETEGEVGGEPERFWWVCSGVG